MKTYRIIYKDMDLDSKSGKERTEKFIKPLFWNRDVENWENFDGEISVQNIPNSSCNDGAIVVINTDKATESVIINALKTADRVKILEIKEGTSWIRLR